ncbi:MAG: polysaccharide export protein [Leptolyngbyaceae cyanobacterium CSU_1_4]|nr:polysaccharide export protein [Leptolyngbyaceae cyanobacterium CSU_1_4]
MGCVSFGVLITVFFALPGWSLPLSPGDRIKVSIPEGDLFQGTYEINLDGGLKIPYLSSVPVAGLEPAQVEQVLKQEFIKAALFNPKFIQVSVQVSQWAAIQVNVAGETFQPGRVIINQRSPEELANSTSLSGDYPPQRFLTAAIQAAGGVLPTANVKHIQLIRNGEQTTFDLSGIFNGEIVGEVPLIAGDQIIVPDSGHFHTALVRPSQITIPGLRVFLSNLTQPAINNAGAGINKDSTAFVYGSRFSQAVVAANCVGGGRENAKRRAVLVHTDRITGQTEAIDRPVEQLLRAANDDETNPFLMPDDGVACYDSATTNLRGVAQVLGDIFSPFSLLFNLLR